jgi:hypothetical protein
VFGASPATPNTGGHGRAQFLTPALPRRVALLYAVLIHLPALRWGILIRGSVLPGGAANGEGRRGIGDHELLAGAVTALAVVLGQRLLDYPLRNPVIATTVWLLVGLLAATVSRRDQRWRRGTEEIAVRHVRQLVSW